MTLPTPINWLHGTKDSPTKESDVEKTLMFFHTDIRFTDDVEMAKIIRSCVFHATTQYGDIWYEGIIRESDREKVQEFLTLDDNFKEFGATYEELEFGESPNWVWITDTAMTLCDKLEFVEQYDDKKDVRFWMLVQDYEHETFETADGTLPPQHYNRSGRCHVVLIETQNLGNWDPIPRENLEIYAPNSVHEFDLPKWIYDLGTDDEDDPYD